MNHICSDPEQYLFEQCTNKEKKNDTRCTKPAWISHETCQQHTTLECSKTKHLMSGIEIAKKAKDARKRKLDQAKLEKKDDKINIVNRSSRRASRNREDSLLRSPQCDTVQHSSKIQILDESLVNATTSLQSMHSVKHEDTSGEAQHSQSELKHPDDTKTKDGVASEIVVVDTKTVLEKSSINVTNKD